MAQGAVAFAPTNGATLTAEELREILEYERIVQFRDAVLAGTHPRVKIPAHLAGKQFTSTRNVSSPISSTPRANSNTQHARSTSTSHPEESSFFFNKSLNQQRVAGNAHVPISSNSEIDPILLGKSEHLIKAEIMLQRQRLERDLKQQIEQQRIAAKALLQTSESLPNFNLSEVLSKALAIVHPSTTAEAEPSAAVRSPASDSFDENTFYSSQHDTPEPSSPAQGQTHTAELQSHGKPSLDQPPTGIVSAQNQVDGREVVMTGTSLSNNNNVAMQAQSQKRYSPLPQNTTTDRREQDMVAVNSASSTSSGEIVPNDAHGTVKATTRDLLKEAFDNISNSPLIRAHDLSPIAPQPARVSPLATAREPPIIREYAAINGIPPVAISTIRNKPTGHSSTDSSPKGVKGNDKKKDKKKRKRKGTNAADTPDSPYIKPEPRSPSPYTAVAPLPRPQKRQRQSGQYAAELNYDEPSYEPSDDVQMRIPRPQYKEVPVPRAHERVEERYEPEYRRVEPAYRRVERDEEDSYRRVVEGQYERRPQSPAVFAVPYATSEARQVRAASHAVVDRRVYEEPRYFRESVMRASVRPDADRERSRSPIMHERRSPVAMAPPRQPMRIVIDADGRKYYEPMPAMRQSVAPPIRYREPDVVYERAPMRAVSSRLPAEFEEDGVIYRRPSPALATPRRVVTQPEYALPPQPEYRSYRQREYSVRPTAMGPPGEEYVQVRGRPMTPEEGRREYVQRAPSAYPEVRYEIPREYARLQSVRPEAPPREYTASVRPEARREVIAQPQREYSVRPEVRREVIAHPQREYSVRPEARREVIATPQREYSVRPEAMHRREQVMVPEGERYYEEVAGRRPVDVAFIERPRARESSVMVYADNVRREVYRQ